MVRHHDPHRSVDDPGIPGQSLRFLPECRGKPRSEKPSRNLRFPTNSIRRLWVSQFSEAKVWEWASTGKQVDIFSAKYVMYSNVAHHAARDLERRITKRAEGHAIDSIAIGIDDGNPAEIVLDALFVLMRAVGAYAKAFDREIPESLLNGGEEIEGRFADLVAEPAVTPSDQAPGA